MERREYDRLAAVEEQGWWFRGLHENLIRTWQEAQPRGEGAVLLDAGCGTGGLLARMKNAAPQVCCIGLELDAVAAATARDKSAVAIVAGSILAPPFAPRSCDAIFSADVLCHRGVEPSAALTALLPCLKPGGLLILNLPAYRWLLSGHDLAVDNVRRFGARETRALLADAGFAKIRIRYWNSLLFPLMLAQRLVHRGAKSDVGLFPAAVERLFHAIVRLEQGLSSLGLRLPFGGSILAVAMKP